MYAAVTATANSQFSSFPGISTFQLASQYKQFEFFASPRYVTQNANLSSDAKLLYGFYNSKAGTKGYVEKYTREQIQKELGFSTDRRLDRAQAELKAHNLILSIQIGNGDPKIVLLLSHPDMGLPEKELIARRIKLQPEIQRRVERVQKRNKTALPQMANLPPSALPPAATPKEITATTKEPEKELALASAQAIPSNDQDQIRKPETTPSICPHCTERLTPSSPPDIPAENAGGSAEREVESTTTQDPERQQKPKTRKPRSKHSLELCRRFAQAEKDRKGSIEDVEDFAQACYWLGRHDKEIDRWLKKRAAGAVRQTRTTTASSKVSSAQPNGQPETVASGAEAERAAQLAQQQRVEAMLAEMLAEQQRDEAEKEEAAKVDPEIKQAVEEAAKEVKREMQRKEGWKHPNGSDYARRVNERLKEWQIKAPRLVIHDIIIQILSNWLRM